MIFRSARFRKLHTLLALTLFAGLVHAEPDAEAILEAARLSPVGQNMALDAQLRTDRQVVPMKIVVDGAVHYVFRDPSQELILELKDDAAVLSEKTGGKEAQVRPARYDDPVRNSGVTYEDLSLQFLYWRSPKILGEDLVGMQKAWKMELQAARASSQYGVARLWIDQKSGALLRIEGYNKEGKLLRKFEVISGQKIDGKWMLKQMRIDTQDPEKGKTVMRTYLEVLGKAQ